MDDIDLALALAVGYLEAPDALTACFVCHGWRDALSTDGDNGQLAWKRVCRNIDALKTALFLANASAPIDYKRLAIRLTIDRSVRTDIRIPTTGTVPPTPLLLHDLFLMAEVYSVETVNGVQRKVPISAWTAPMTYPPKTEISIKEEECILKGKNPYAEPISAPEASRPTWRADSPRCLKPTCLVGSNGDLGCENESARLRLTLIHSTTLDSLSLMDDGLLLDWDDRDDDDGHDYDDWIWRSTSWNGQRLTQTQGEYELSLKKIENMNCVPFDFDSTAVQLKATFEVMLPSPWSSREPSWLRKCRSGEPFIMPTHTDLDELRQTRHFNFQLKTISLDFKKKFSNEEFESENALLVKLKRSRWWK